MRGIKIWHKNLIHCVSALALLYTDAVASREYVLYIYVYASIVGAFLIKLISRRYACARAVYNILL